MTERPPADELGTRISVSLQKVAREELAQIARSKKVSVAWVVREAIDQYIASQAPLFYRGKR